MAETTSGVIRRAREESFAELGTIQRIIAKLCGFWTLDSSNPRIKEGNLQLGARQSIGPGSQRLCSSYAHPTFSRCIYTFPAIGETCAMRSPPPTKTIEDVKTSVYALDAEDGAKEEELKALYPTDRESRNLHVPTDYAAGRLRASSPDGFSEMSMDDRYSLQVPRRGSGSGNFPSPATPAVGSKAKVLAFWARNKGVGYVLLSQVFGTLMNVTTRYVERLVLKRIHQSCSSHVPISLKFDPGN